MARKGTLKYQNKDGAVVKKKFGLPSERIFDLHIVKVHEKTVTVGWFKQNPRIKPNLFGKEDYILKEVETPNRYIGVGVTLMVGNTVVSKSR